MSSSRLGGSLLAVAFVVVFITQADAQGNEGAPYGTGDDALPGVIQTDDAVPMRQGLSATLATGYGYTGALLEQEDSHHRGMGRLAVAYAFGESLALAMRFDGRYDKHFGGTGDDHGWVGDPRILARYHHALTPAIGVALQLGLWLPGSDAPSVVFAAVSPEPVVAVTWHPSFAPLIVSGNLGYRLDRSIESVSEPERLSLADRIALGLSDSDALLLRLGASYRLGRTELLGEWSMDWLQGASAGPIGRSPMRTRAGIRFALDETTELSGHVDIRTNTVILSDVTDGLVPIEPTVQVLVALHKRFDVGAAPKPVKEIVIEEPPPPEPTTTQFRGVVSSDGRVLANAEVIITDSQKNSRTIRTDADGSFTVADIVIGVTHLSVKRKGYEPHERDIALVAQDNPVIEIQLERTLPPGQLRGLVQSFDGKPLVAELTVSPGDVALTTDADGTFRVDLPPGDYEVSISADGYQMQMRSISIVNEGVTILNVDLRR